MRRLLYSNFKRFYRFSRWTRRRFTSAGLLVLAVMVASGVVGIDTRFTMAYQIAGLAAALIIVSFISGVFFRARFAIERLLPDLATAGEVFEYKIKIGNLTHKNQPGLYIREKPDTSLPTFESFLHSREPGEEKRNWFDRYVGYPRWEWLVSQSQGADAEEVSLPIIPAGSTIEILLSLKPRRRGNIILEGMTLIRRDPLGLIKTPIDVEVPATLLVLPRRIPVPGVHLSGARHYQPGGITQVSSVGDAEEFFSLRDYRPGDPLRHVHWRSWARTGKPVVKEFQEEYFVRYGLVLDTFTVPSQALAFEDAVILAASYVATSDAPDALLDLMFVGSDAYCFTGGRGLLPTSRMLEILACATPSHGQAFETLHNLLVRRMAQLSGCVCIFLSWDEKRRELVKCLRANGVALEVVLVTDGLNPVDSGPMRDQPGRLHIVTAGSVEETFIKR